VPGSFGFFEQANQFNPDATTNTFDSSFGGGATPFGSLMPLDFPPFDGPGSQS
jgi:hypothetical protein